MIKLSQKKKRELKSLLSLQSKTRKAKALENKLKFRKGKKTHRINNLKQIEKNFEFQFDLDKMKKIYSTKNGGKKNGKIKIL